MRLVIGGIVAIDAVVGGVLALVPIGVATLLPAVVAALALFFLALALVGDHTKVVIGELEEVFLVDAVTVKVRVVCELAILLEQLRRITARAAIDAVQLLATALLTIVTPAAPAVIPTVIVQG
jgi:hypothetical protein